MEHASDLSILLSPLVAQYQDKSLLLAGDTAIKLVKDLHDTRSQVLKTPFSLEQLADLPQIDLAIVSDLLETLTKEQSIEWLSMLRNGHAQQLILITSKAAEKQQGWQLTDYLALGFNQLFSDSNSAVYSYNIVSYRPKRDWLNSRFWANPENYDKYRW
jgi:hypothetical protein